MSSQKGTTMLLAVGVPRSALVVARWPWVAGGSGAPGFRGRAALDCSELKLAELEGVVGDHVVGDDRAHAAGLAHLQRDRDRIRDDGDGGQQAKVLLGWRPG